MFKLIETDEPIQWPVTVHVPQHGGKTAKHKFTALFAYLPADDIAPASEAGDEAFLGRVLLGWQGVQDEEGNPLPFSDEARDRLVRIPYVRRALILAWHEFIQGRAAKN